MTKPENLGVTTMIEQDFPLEVQCKKDLDDAIQEQAKRKLKDLHVYGIYLMDELAEKLGAMDIKQLSPDFLEAGTSNLTTTKIKEWSDFDSILVVGVTMKGDNNDQ